MNVLIADKFEAAGTQKLTALGCNVTQDADLSGTSLTEAVRDGTAEVLIVRSTKVDQATLDAGTNLKLVIRAGAGFNTIQYEYARTKNIAVANCPGMNSIAVAELAFGLMLNLDRRIVDNTGDLRRGVWNKKEYSKVSRARGLKGRTVGIVGLGQIGAGIARRAKAFEMDLLYFDVIDYPELEQELGIRKVDLDTLYKESDFITLHVPLNDHTRHMISTAQFAMMKPTAFVINISRGPIVNEEDLLLALNRETIAGAGLDVLNQEPPAPDHPLLNHERVVVTPHTAGVTEQSFTALGRAVADNVERLKKGEPLENEAE